MSVGLYGSLGNLVSGVMRVINRARELRCDLLDYGATFETSCTAGNVVSFDGKLFSEHVGETNLTREQRAGEVMVVVPALRLTFGGDLIFILVRLSH